MYPVLEAYKEGKLKDLWQAQANSLVMFVPKLSHIRCQCDAAAMLQARVWLEFERLEKDSSSIELLDWIYVNEGSIPSPAELLIDYSGSRSLIMDAQDFTELYK